MSKNLKDQMTNFDTMMAYFIIRMPVNINMPIGPIDYQSSL